METLEGNTPVKWRSIRLLVPGTSGGLMRSFVVCTMMQVSFAQTDKLIGRDPHFTISGNFDAAYRKTQFFQDHHNAFVGQWDSRAEVWLPPSRTRFSFGPYLRITGIAASKPEAWENAWLGGPGVGFQVYPFSYRREVEEPSGILKALGPMRVFAEYNRMRYWGAENSWRPTRQTRLGVEDWRSFRVNNVRSPWWAETWNGLSWQSANEFSSEYKSVILGNALRAGLRASSVRALAPLTPYVALESSVTDNQAYYWENRLLAGGGIRFAPSLIGPIHDVGRLNRLAIYAEYLRVASYYRQSAPSSVPSHEVRVGITFSTGVWYR